MVGGWVGARVHGVCVAGGENRSAIKGKGKAGATQY